ncbi:MAG: hypothetical protein AAGH41_05360 [Pseudomonadota bacterium]
MTTAQVLQQLAPLRDRALALADRLAAAERGNPRFFRGVSVLLLLIVVLGFGKSFFARPAFANFPVAPIVLVHGGVMTLWFVVYLAQTFLVSGGFVRLHRWLGASSIALACAIVGTIIPTTYGFPMRRFNADVPGYDFMADLPHITMVVHGNTAMLIQFTLLFSLGVLFRRRIETHRRLMTLAAIAVVIPAASRLNTLFGPAGVTSELLGIAMAFGLPSLVAIYDFVMTRRFRPVTIFGLGLIYGTLALFGLIGKSPLGPEITLRIAGAA